MQSLALTALPDAAPAGTGLEPDWAACTRWQAAPDGRREAVSQLQLFGMHCAACAGLIEQALLGVDGVCDARVQAGIERAELRWDPQRTTPAAMLEALQRAGYRAAPDATASARAERRRELRRALWRVFVAGFCMMQVMMYATPMYVAAPGEMPPDIVRLLQWAGWLLSLPVVLFSAGPFFAGAWRSLRQRRIGMDVPVALGVAVTFVVSSGATFEPGGVFGHEVYFDSLTMFVAFLLLGRYLELRARHRVAAELEASVARLPETALRIDAAGHAEAVAVAVLRPGDRVRVLAGQAMPADGDVLDGRSAADEALLTGESQPVPKAAGDAVVAGSLNLAAPLLVRVTRTGPDTRHAQIVALMRQAFSERPALLRAADRIAAPFLWGVLLLAALAAAAWSVIDPSRAVWVAVSVLIVTCPCALSLAAPSALLVAAGALARRGVLLRRLEALETLARVDLLVLDKTGTLTDDRFHVQAFEARGDAVARAEARVRAVSLAGLSAHPLARALAALGETAGLPWHDVAEVPGRGVQARDAVGRLWRLGAADWVSEGRDEPAHGVADLPAPTGNAAASVWLGRSGSVIARCDLGASLRPDAARVVAALRAEGISLRLLSGDAPARVQAVAARLGIADARGGASPEDKLQAVADAQAAGHCVAMVGDGINDAPVLARADVSFAMGQGAAIAKLQADAVLIGDRLDGLVAARRLARRTMRVMRQSLAWAVVYNAACIPLALAGWLPPWAAGLGMATSSLAVLLNALRLGRDRGEPAAR